MSLSLKQLRSLRAGKTQTEFASELNAVFSRSYDKSRISKWESGRESVPDDVEKYLQSLIALSGDAPRRPLVIALANQKGGVSKTVSAVNLAYLLSAHGRTLLIDMDPQSNATTHVGIFGHVSPSLSDVLFHNVPLTQAIHQVPDEDSLFIVPPGLALSEAERQLPGRVGHEIFLRDRIRKSEGFDFYVIDLPPTLGVLTINGLSAADYVVIPSNTARFSIDGIHQLLNTISQVRDYLNPVVSILGVLPTRHNASALTERAALEELVQMCQSLGLAVFDPVPQATLYEQACSAGQITLKGAPDVKGAATYHHIANLIARLGLESAHV